MPHTCSAWLVGACLCLFYGIVLKCCPVPHTCSAWLVGVCLCLLNGIVLKVLSCAPYLQCMVGWCVSLFYGIVLKVVLCPIPAVHGWLVCVCVFVPAVHLVGWCVCVCLCSMVFKVLSCAPYLQCKSASRGEQEKVGVGSYEGGGFSRHLSTFECGLWLCSQQGPR